MRKPIVVGNWKMNKTIREAVGLVSELKRLVVDVSDVEIGVAPPFTALSSVRDEIGGASILLGGQDAFWETGGAFTGEISPAMLKDAGCDFVILGHSERRQHFRETDAEVNKKIKAVLGERMFFIVCVGESLEQREAGKASSVVGSQIRGCLTGLSSGDMQRLVIAYEPVWAIGTGKTATPQIAEEMHGAIRAIVEDMFGGDTAEAVRIQYGGSVNPDNIEDLMKEPDIDGALVGGASLKAEAFSQIVRHTKK
jgi:triosephosphate isomerase